MNTDTYKNIDGSLDAHTDIHNVFALMYLYIFEYTLHRYKESSNQYHKTKKKKKTILTSVNWHFSKFFSLIFRSSNEMIYQFINVQIISLIFCLFQR